jgi:hypothetical protein
MPANTRGQCRVSSCDAAIDGLRGIVGHDSTQKRCWIDGWDLDDGLEKDFGPGDIVRRLDYLRRRA